MNRRRFHVVLLMFLLFMISSCQSTSLDDELNGRITLWHSWSPTESLVLEAALAQFEEIHPNVRIIKVALPEDQILDSFYDSGNDGLGPSLLIGDDSWIGELAESGLIRPLNSQDLPTSIFHVRNRALTQYYGEVYGFPLSLAPQALYYNQQLTVAPPETLNDLLQEAADGRRVAFVPRFEEAYWGIQTFGEGLFNEDGNFTLAESGFTEWLDWLDNAQQAPGIILNIDDQSLLELFTSGQITYYVAGPDKQARIDRKITDTEGENFAYGVAPLPDGPVGEAGPLLPSETILLYAFTSDAQAKIANELATFLTNQQQSIRFMRELNKVPANTAVRVDRRIYPIVNGFATQARTAVVIPNEIPSAPLYAAGDRAYVSALSGVLSPEEAVCRFGQEVIAIEGYSPARVSLPEGCEFPQN